MSSSVPSGRARRAVACCLFAAILVPSSAEAATPRAYELVSPVQKNGTDVNQALRSAADGDAIAFNSYGGFGDAASNLLQTTYVARRSALGWRTTSLSPPAPQLSPTLDDLVAPIDLTADLGTMFADVHGATALDPGDQNAATDVYAADGTAATWLSPGLARPDTASGDAVYGGRSDDGRHVVLQSSRPLTADGPAGVAAVYDRSGGTTRLASVPPAGAPAFAGAAVVGGGRLDPSRPEPGDRRAVSADGSRILFTADDELYVRIDGTTTRLVSASHRTDGSAGTPSPAPATFGGASDDGRRVVFWAAAPLTDDAVHGGLYLADLDAGTLALLADVDPAEGTVLGTVRTAADGARTSFVSDAALAPGAIAGEPNLYMSAPGRPPALVATLSPSDDGTWSRGENGNDAALSPDGHRLVFDTTNNVMSYDNGGLREVYVYDERSARVSCVSCPPDGTAATGDAQLRGAGAGVAPRNVTDAGTVVFETSQGLVPGDTDGQSDVYEREADGALRLVSPGTSLPVHLVDASPDGRDVFLLTAAALVPADVDGGYVDLYDARSGGGFPEPAPPCAGAACRGPQSPGAPPAAVPPSTTATDTSVAGAAPRHTLRLTRPTANAIARWPRTGRLRLAVRVGDAAVVTARARAAGDATATVASATGSRTTAGTLHLTLRLRATGRAALRRHGRLTVRITVTRSDATTAAHASVVLRAHRAR